MSLRVLGYENGRRIVVDEGPARARPQGYGGAALGQATVTFVFTNNRQEKRPTTREERRSHRKRPPA